MPLAARAECRNGVANARREFPLRVLCLDDNHDLADSLGLILTLVGFDVKVCYDGPCALKEAAEFHPDVCLIDLHMPKMSGDEVARRMTAQFAGDPPLLVAVTAMGTDLHRVLTRDAGFQFHLVKPVEPRVIIQLLESHAAPGHEEFEGAEK